ncbi:MAG: alpha/beta hydrolase [Lachnospiraceae bacterium]|nr:alpha/beta hydrolase [Lachnospiraceae bacterium]
MKRFDKHNTLNEILEETRPEMALFFPDSLLCLVPEEYRDKPLSFIEQHMVMPWGAPFPADDLVRESAEIMQAREEKTWNLTPLWIEDPSRLTFDTNNEDSVFLLHLNSRLSGTCPAVIICPGGGYENLACNSEGLQIARRMEADGYRCFILTYRCSPNRYPAPQLDLLLAVGYLRANAAQFEIDPGDLMVLGFSAGGHLCASAAALHEQLRPELMERLAGRRPGLVPALKDISLRPDKVCLCYPVISFLEEAHESSFQSLTGGDESLRGALSAELIADEDYPKTFIWACLDDGLVPPGNAIRMAKALEEKDVPCELRLYPQGDHGCGLAAGTSAAGWMDDMLRFMKDQVQQKN